MSTRQPNLKNLRRITDHVSLDSDWMGPNEYSGVVAELRDLIEDTAAKTNTHVIIRSGKEKRRSGYHPSGRAIDLWIYDPSTGKTVPHGAGGINPVSSKGARDGFGAYQKFAHEMHANAEANPQRFPDAKKKFAWGGYFGGGKDVYGALDTMQYDYGGARGRGGSFKNGLNASMARTWGLAPGIHAKPGAINRPGTPAPTRLANGKSADPVSYTMTGSRTAGQPKRPPMPILGNAMAQAMNPAASPQPNGGVPTNANRSRLLPHEMAAAAEASRSPAAPPAISPAAPPAPPNMPTAAGGGAASGSTTAAPSASAAGPGRAPPAADGFLPVTGRPPGAFDQDHMSRLTNMNFPMDPMGQPKPPQHGGALDPEVQSARLRNMSFPFMQLFGGSGAGGEEDPLSAYKNAIDAYSNRSRLLPHEMGGGEVVEPGAMTAAPQPIAPDAPNRFAGFSQLPSPAATVRSVFEPQAMPQSQYPEWVQPNVTFDDFYRGGLLGMGGRAARRRREYDAQQWQFDERRRLHEDKALFDQQMADQERERRAARNRSYFEGLDPANPQSLLIANHRAAAAGELDIDSLTDNANAVSGSIIRRAEENRAQALLSSETAVNVQRLVQEANNIPDPKKQTQWLEIAAKAANGLMPLRTGDVDALLATTEEVREISELGRMSEEDIARAGDYNLMKAGTLTPAQQAETRRLEAADRVGSDRRTALTDIIRDATTSVAAARRQLLQVEDMEARGERPGSAGYADYPAVMNLLATVTGSNEMAQRLATQSEFSRNQVLQLVQNSQNMPSLAPMTDRDVNLLLEMGGGTMTNSEAMREIVGRQERALQLAEVEREAYDGAIAEGKSPAAARKTAQAAVEKMPQVITSDRLSLGEIKDLIDSDYVFDGELIKIGNTTLTYRKSMKQDVMRILENRDE